MMMPSTYPASPSTTTSANGASTDGPNWRPYLLLTRVTFPVPVKTASVWPLSSPWSAPNAAPSYDFAESPWSTTLTR